MMLCRFRFESRGEPWTAAQLDTLRGLIHDELQLDADGQLYTYMQLTGDVRAVRRAFPSRNITIMSDEMPLQYAEHLLSRLEDLVSKPQQPQFNERVQVAIPNLGLLTIRYVKVLENCCTDSLQDALDEGWAILAVCPQEQRRPDYVMGRSTQP